MSNAGQPCNAGRKRKKAKWYENRGRKKGRERERIMKGRENNEREKGRIMRGREKERELGKNMRTTNKTALKLEKINRS